MAMLFTPRSCPHCGSTRRHTLLKLSTSVICKSNWSYRADAADRLDVGPDESFPIDECLNCGFIFAGMLPDSEFLAQVYDSAIDTEAARASNLSRASLARKMGDLSALFQVLDPTCGAIRLLDYGCGFGPALEVLRCLPHVHSLGYETSIVRLRELVDRGLTATGDLAVVANEAPYHVVLLDNVLEHLPQPRQALEYVRKVCAEGALLYVSVPGIDKKAITSQQAAASRGTAVMMDINPWEHLNYFSVGSLDALLEEFGFMPFRQASFPDQVNVGLRASPSFAARLKNGLASMARLGRYVWHGEGLTTVNRRFYRLEPT